MGKLALAVSLLLFLAPGRVLAAQFHQLPDQLIFQSDTRLYRHQSNRWQLAAVNRFEQGLVFRHRLYGLEINDQGGQLMVSEDGLRFLPINLPRLNHAQLISRGNQLILAGADEGVRRMFLSSDGQTFTAPTDIPLNGEVTEIFFFQGTIFQPVWDQSELLLYQLTNNRWHLLHQRACPSGEAFTEPFPGLICEGTIFQLTDSAQYSALPLLSDLRAIQTSPTLIGGLDRNEPAVIHLYNLREISWRLSEPITAWQLIGRRLFFQLNRGWIELLWDQSEPAEVQITDRANLQITVPENDLGLFFSDPTVHFLSREPGKWQEIKVTNPFNQARKTPAGWLIWQTDPSTQTGGLTQYAEDGNLQFAKVNPWSSTGSPIQTLITNRAPALLVVRTRSGKGNFNLYRSDDLRRWRLTSLPSQPTFSSPISQVRALSAGSLAEVSGTVSVPPGIINPQTIYLQDETGGIQIYLSGSSGSLDYQAGQGLIVSGEISGAKIKRLLLDDPETIKIGEAITLSQPTVALESAERYLGQIVEIESLINKVEKSALFLGQNLFKLRFTETDRFRANDIGRFPALIDWNSASDRVEGWYLGEGAKLLHRPQVVETSVQEEIALVPVAESSRPEPPIVPSDSSPVGPAAPAKETTGEITANQAPNTEMMTEKIPTVRVSGVNQKATQPRSEVELAALMILGLVSGLLIRHGFRVRQLIVRLDY